MLEQRGILVNSMRKYHKAGSPFNASGGTRTTKCTEGTERQRASGSPLKINRNTNGVAFPIRSASPERVADGLR